MKVLKAIAAALLLAGTGFAGDLKIVGETQVLPYRLVELRPEGAAPASAILWDVYPEESVDSRESNGVLTFVAPPGTYRIKLRSIVGNTVQIARATVVIGQPAPAPTPTPTPTPIPSAKVAWVIVVEDVSQRTVETARILSDAAFWAGLRMRGVDHEFYDAAAPVVKANRYDVAAQRAGRMPAMLLLSQSGDVIKAIPLPLTTQDIAKEIP